MPTESTARAAIQKFLILITSSVGWQIVWFSSPQACSLAALWSARCGLVLARPDRKNPDDGGTSDVVLEARSSTITRSVSSGRENTIAIRGRQPAKKYNEMDD
jgi:hypothetical protein